MTREEMLASLKATLSENRFRHTLNVCEFACRYCALYGIERTKAETAALLHDCAKSMNAEEMLSVCRQAGISPDEYELSAEPVLHAPAGAALSRLHYEICDPEILDAVRWHTIGCPAPSPLTKLIYVSDFAELGRRPFEGLQEVRRLMDISLDRALILSAKLSSEYVVSKGGTVHPITHQMILNTEVHL